MTVRRECAKCDGTGNHSLSWLVNTKCDVCHGSGFVELGNVELGNVVQGAFVAPNPDLSADEVLAQSMGQLDEVVIVGYDTEGNEYYNSNVGSGAMALWHLKRAIHNLMKTVDNVTGED